VNAHLILAAVAALAVWLGSLYWRPFGPCPKCNGTGTIKRIRKGKRGKRRVAVKVCPRCKGRRRVQRPGSRTVHRPPAGSARGGRPPPATSRRTAMGHPDGAHTHGSGGSGLGEVIVILLAVALLGPAVAAAVAELVHVLLIMAGVVVGAGAAGLVGLLAWQLRRTRVDAARTMPPLPSKMVRAARPLPQARRAGELPAAPQREPPGGLHLHFHGLDAAQVAAIIARQ
jgi:Flp pilus assembly protein TadB